ncbi:DJ-1/PfpI family protein [Methylobacterium durans]|uniref:DJ-1/PfpI family protein n=1 Tax=Methylobacterium durans TaxID=2202825 RepID=UPI002AFED42D|nr:DJ-1/PfpI family protein [Methylobacterium durans]MEA1834911.1 DJ-1/PfpI family protein [Methylobacterium durans]
MRAPSAPARIGILLYEGVEPIDLGGTLGVISMARRSLPLLEDAVIAREAGPVRLAGGLPVLVPYGFEDAPPCDVTIVCGGPGWPEAARDPALIAFLRRHAHERLASVCTGALILAATGLLDGRAATTRRARVGSEERSPLEVLAERAHTKPALVVDDRIVTGGGVSLAIDTTLYLIGRIYGDAVRDGVARDIEYDRSFAANCTALGVSVDRSSGLANGLRSTVR